MARNRGESGVEQDGTEILAVLEASQPRRVMAVAMLVVLGALLIYLALAGGLAGPVYPLMLALMGAVALWLSVRIWQATSRRLELTREALRESGGEIVVRVEEVAGVERGAFAFKPSNGFVIRMTDRGERRWRPGLWWRTGRRIGIGGVTPGPQGKVMAELLQALRDGTA
ncbi:hypothetical protein E0K89_007330 [Aquicoccus sp. SCR17]|nr:hypothetical protein [Carideicomes alvinocaridis]